MTEHETTLHRIGEEMRVLHRHIEHVIAKHGYTSAAYLPDDQNLAVLVEEVGEVARAMHDPECLAGDLYDELMDAAAVCVMWAARIQGESDE